MKTSKFSMKRTKVTKNSNSNIEVNFESKTQDDQSSKSFVGLVSDYLPLAFKALSWFTTLVELTDKLL